MRWTYVWYANNIICIIVINILTQTVSSTRFSFPGIFTRSSLHLYTTCSGNLCPKRQNSSTICQSVNHMWHNSLAMPLSQLLNRVFNIMREKNPDMVAGEKRKFVMKPPQVVRVGTKKTSFVNFTDICKLWALYPRPLTHPALVPFLLQTDIRFPSLQVASPA